MCIASVELEAVKRELTMARVELEEKGKLQRLLQKELGNGCVAVAQTIKGEILELEQARELAMSKKVEQQQEM